MSHPPKADTMLRMTARHVERIDHIMRVVTGQRDEHTWTNR